MPEGKSLGLKKLEPAAGEMENGLRDLSGTYSLDATGLAVGDSAVIGLPLNTKPVGTVKVMAAQGSQWQELPVLLQYREETNSVYFVYTRPAPPFKIQIRTDISLEKVIVVDAPLKKYGKPQISALPNSAFRIHYYLPDSLDPARVVPDAEWGQRGGHSQYPETPDFIEDLDAALNHTYQQLLTLKGSDGKALFQTSATPLGVWIVERGSHSDASSRLGGPIQFLNRKEDEELSWEDMRLIASHELVHVLQGQYYKLWGLSSGFSNRWFIEATANNYALRANGLVNPSSADFPPISNETASKWYTPNFPDTGFSYLSAPLTDSNDGSMYSAGHFLQWLTDHVGDSIVADTLLKGTYSDASTLNEILMTKGRKEGLAGTLWEYARDLLTHPETPPNRAFIANMENYHGEAFLKHHDPLLLSPTQLYANYSSPLASLSGLFAEVQMRNLNEPLLFVVDPTDTLATALPGTADDLHSLSYAGAHGSSTEFAAAKPLENGPGFGRQMLAIPVIGTGKIQTLIQQLVFNATFRGMIRTPVLHYYLLRAPKVTLVGEDFVSWDPRIVGNIPSKFIKGFRVYGREISVQNPAIQGNWKQMSGLIPYQSGVASQQSSFAPASPGNRYEFQISVTDRFDNQWPRISTGQRRLVLTQTPAVIPNGNLDLGQSVNLTASVEGLDDTRVTWKLALAPEHLDPVFPLGSLAVNGNKATYTAPSSDSQVIITATSVADPNLSESVTFASGGFGLCGFGGDWNTLGC